MKLTSIQSEVVNSFINLIEKIGNGKTNILDFGSEDMIFYRGEIHIIKMIGDYPGIYSSEIARNFGITRAVVHKTLLKLEKRNLVEKKQDLEDKKKQKLFLTQKGNIAYKYHEDYHEQHDKALFDFIKNLTEEELDIINEFLKHADNLIQNHF
ncbi:MarR family winged helix-turn-helix transcriptional regulator [Parvimonas micra]|uniref:MarR family transcriptional regulator n=1 Tax=Parvimonas micra TaxID=33033 RepID=A0A9X3K719_9FIRM|nr:MarR family transcriptional regulator [Parvimonas micra]MCZ7407055.1 MarR family transcriptional regulator [Parvimonas micra]MCZ7409815.1 MarR family transcriptional regulator [Parvimonas micra]MCZ7411583.1 MarR family transcriptional regulator [Parvimonas micra]WBB37493.1 MarR family transcriptional regulator [Parvimonas micra]